MTGSFPHDNFNSVYWIFTNLDHMIPLWKGKNPIYFVVIRSKVKVTYYKYNFWQQGRFRTITLVLYIGSLPNLATWFPCGRGRILFILGSLPLYRLIIYIDGCILWCTHFLFFNEFALHTVKHEYVMSLSLHFVLVISNLSPLKKHSWLKCYFRCYWNLSWQPACLLVFKDLQTKIKYCLFLSCK
jgi:hypothetical protein